MSRKKPPAFKLRKPAAADMDAFVSAGTTEPAKTSRRPGVQASKRKGAKNGGASERQRTTIYFSPEVRKRLAVYCAERDAEMSEVVTEAVSKFLNRS